MPTFLVIGSGIAGLNFALNASKLGQVLIITKKHAIDTSTNYAQGGIAGVLDKYDSFDKHIKDTLIAGSYHNDQKAVKFMVKNAPSAIKNLINYGVKFASHDGELLLTREGGHSERRIAFVGDYTGQEIELALLANVKKNKNIKIWENCFACELILNNDQKSCLGATAIKNQKIMDLYADYTILATGGCGQVYLHTTNPKISTGDGLAMGYRAGLKFQDLEFIQFHPTAFNYWGEAKFLISEAVRGEGAYLKNNKGERFMLKRHKLAELAPRDIVAINIYEESKKSPIYLDITHKDPNEVKLRFPKIYDWLKDYGFDLTKDLIPITPAAHYSCGGIKVNLKSETGVKNLYAFGEVACTGVHGANRLASNSLVEALVFSDAIIKNLAQKNADRTNITKIQIKKNKSEYLKLNKKLENKLIAMQKNLKNLMWEKVGILRKMAEMAEALESINQLKSNLPANTKGLNEMLLETENLLITAELITKSAMARPISLGGHYIKDH
ncbi:MAG: L-aspartate oxidase, L-aspartate oxidase [Candidatus Peregrinibacteria bacterium GW2011_GWF2_33_10]|nr:MAG: L-aspartate oxidase, L-aspartate oxidase [Candidatus Peregrinibacteria bacterium GW2011_GWF2_33_10]OGJ44737.1 MAG: L-aspartate oxidase [Candidatus Peregrinibacteria bacterium RIFOXYA2_FULL_33_21]OGJ47336.1 MAG: L-aspartate oxidase [Candidatus Peregrinibacteria bacterium RIFOXYA12_FULL_33_12]OGJ50603.1 MAG: L-aspartate oxidase [Candidatus Peregrinibacteria bacterium RIFOXYB2_FULL_33_20]